MYQIKAREMLINNPGSIPQNSPPFGQKMAGKPQIYGEISPEKLQFTENDGYGWIGLRMLSSKMVEFVGKVIEDGHKMAKIVAAI